MKASSSFGSAVTSIDTGSWARGPTPGTICVTMFNESARNRMIPWSSMALLNTPLPMASVANWGSRNWKYRSSFTSTVWKKPPMSMSAYSAALALATNAGLSMARPAQRVSTSW